MNIGVIKNDNGSISSIHPFITDLLPAGFELMTLDNIKKKIDEDTLSAVYGQIGMPATYVSILTNAKNASKSWLRVNREIIDLVVLEELSKSSDQWLQYKSERKMHQDLITFLDDELVKVQQKAKS